MPEEGLEPPTRGLFPKCFGSTRALAGGGGHEGDTTADSVPPPEPTEGLGPVNQVRMLP
jgi:hypothetical protein